MRDASSDIVTTILDQMLSAGIISNAQKREIVTLEGIACSSDRGVDAKAHLATLHEDETEVQVVSDLLAKVKQDLSTTLLRREPLDCPTFDVITGSPGAGKTHLAQMLRLTNDAFYICGDIVKRAFVAEVQRASRLSQSEKSRYADAVYIHRLTSHIGWALLEESICRRLSSILEMLGMDSAADAGTINATRAAGYTVDVHHVMCNVDVAIRSAVLRYLSRDSSDSGRYVSLSNIARKHARIRAAFGETISAIEADDVRIHLYDNTSHQMREIVSVRLGALTENARQMMAGPLQDRCHNSH